MKALQSIVAILLWLSCSLFAFQIDTHTKIAISKGYPALQEAATELRRYLHAITGEKLPIVVADGGKNTILLTREERDPGNKRRLFLKPDAFWIEAKGERLRIVASNDRALFYGIYHLLRRYLGCRFLTRNYEIIPKNPHPTLPDIDDLQVPRFAYRELFFLEADDPRFARKLGLNGRLGHRIELNPNHLDIALYNGFTPYSLLDRERYACDGQVDFSDPSLQNLATKALMHRLRTLDITPEDLFMIEHEDVDSYCTRGIPPGERPSAPFVQYGRYIATHIPPPYRRHLFLLQAYQWSLHPPKHASPLPKNLGVFFSPIEMDFSRPIDSAPNRIFDEALQAWRPLSDEIYIWHYTIDFGGYLQPFPNLPALAQDLKYFSKIPQIKGVFLQGDYEGDGSDLADLRIWLFSRLLWNPDLSEKRLIKEFCDLYYGPASEAVQAYLRLRRTYLRRSGAALLIKNSADAPYLDLSFVDRAETLLLKGARACRKKSPEYTHLMRLFAGLDYIRLLKAPQGKRRARSLKRFKRFLKSVKVERYAEGADVARLETIISLPRTEAPPPPHTVGKRKNISWFDYQEYALQLCCAKIVSDPAASDGVAVTMPGSRSDWGFQLYTRNLPKGKWDVYAMLKITLNPSRSLLHQARFAYFYGIYPRSKGGKLIAQCTPGAYQSVRIGTLDTRKEKSRMIWIRPPENDAVRTLYLDRIYLVAHSGS